MFSSNNVITDDSSSDSSSVSSNINKFECFSEYRYLSPTRFVDEFVKIYNTDTSFGAQLWVVYDKDFIRHCKYDEAYAIITPKYVSIDKYTIFDKVMLCNIFNTKNIGIKVHFKYIDYDDKDGCLLSIEFAESSFTKDGHLIKYHKCDNFYHPFFENINDTYLQERSK